MRIFFISFIFPLLLCVNTVVSAKTISGLGTIEPAGGVIELAGPTGDIIEAIMVTQGELVKKGQKLATFYGTEQAQLQLSTERLQQAMEGQISEQMEVLHKLAIKNAENDLLNARQNYESYQQLNSKAIVNRELELREYNYEKTKISLERVKVEFQEFLLSQTFDQKLTLLEISNAEQQLERVTLSAPVNGEILTIDKSPGESSSHGPILKMADLGDMVVRCEVAEDDIINIKIGQAATIESPALPENITGKVQDIERIINQRLRVGYVTVKLDNPELASRFINMQVTFKIEI